MRRYLIILALLTAFMAAGANPHSGVQQEEGDTLKYRVVLTDKHATAYSLDRPEQFLSAKSIERRQRQHLNVDSTDLPVCPEYVDAIKATGARVIARSKWQNFVTVACSDPTSVSRISALPFVKSVEKVWTVPAHVRRPAVAQRNEVVGHLPHYKDTLYGAAYRQIHISGGDRLHRKGFRGQGMTIAIIDGGFHNLDKIPALKHVDIVGHKDFVNPDDDMFAETSHGLSVLSCMAANTPYSMVGTAPEASFWVLRSEDTYSENPIEQDYWTAAVEFADSVGVDIVNSSLGYNEFDDTSMNFRLRDLDGRSTVISRTASLMAGKGMLLVCSAGNDGTTSWKKITPPADAFDVLSVGAIKDDGELARFSSVGTTADGRIKPDVLAVGVETSIITSQGSVSHSNGTSFAAPIVCGMVACLWQACPKLTVGELIALVRQSGDRADYPDNVYGYGIPDIWKAYQLYLQSHEE